MMIIYYEKDFVRLKVHNIIGWKEHSPFYL